MKKYFITRWLLGVIKTIIVFIIFFKIGYAQSNQKSIKEGLELCYNFKWAQAESIFTTLTIENPENPDGYNFLSSIYLWYYLGNRDKVDFNNFVNYSDQTLETANKELEKDPNNVYLNYLIGSNYMYRAIAFTREENYLDAVWASKKSETYLKSALEIDPKFSDAYLGLGLYNFAVGQIPSAFQWALSLAGIQGDKQIGINYIKKAATQGHLAKVEAQYYLSQILSEVLFENEAALYYLKNLVRRYPNNLLFNYSYAVLEIKERNLRDAQKILSRVITAKDSKFTQIISFAHFLMGDIFFRKNQFDSAKVYYLAFLNSTPTIDYTGIANYRLALSYELTNDRNSAELYFSNCAIGNMDLEDDQYAKRKGEIYSHRTLAVNEADLVKIVNMIESGKYKIAYDSLHSLLSRIKKESLRAEALICLSEVSYKLDKLEESLSNALIAIELNPQEEKWIAPFAAYYAARVYKKNNNTQEFSEIINRIDDYSDFDYQNKLKNLVYAISEKD
jgi:tetratricopeptide (TPR) repeat protein